MTDDPNNSDFEYMAHRRGDTQKDMFYIGAYLGSELNGKLRSLKGKTIANNKTHQEFETLINNNGIPDGNGGSGYDMWGFYQLTFMQCMYVLKYKNLNSQVAVGLGSDSSLQSTGGTETKGMDWGDKSSREYHVKCFGIEAFWGSWWQWIGGVWCDAHRHILTATENFNDSGSGYIDRGNFNISSDKDGYYTKIIGTTHGGFIMAEANGSATTYYCDKGRLYPSRLMRYGGDYYGTGVFCMLLTDGATYNIGGVVARPMYL